MSKSYPNFFSSSTIKGVDASIPNQDVAGCITIKKDGPTDQKKIWDDLFKKIRKKLSSATHLKESRSKFCAILYDPVTQNFSTANLGDSRIYCLLKNTSRKKQENFLISLTCNGIEDANLEDIGYDDPFSELPKNKMMLRDFAKDGSPLILNFNLSKIIDLIPDPLGSIELTEFFVASSGFRYFEKFFTKKNYSNAYFNKIYLLNIAEKKSPDPDPHIITTQSFEEIAGNCLNHSASMTISQENEISLPKKDLTSYLANLARNLGSKDDITVGKIDLQKFYNAMYKNSGKPATDEIVLSFVCDGDGKDGHDLAYLIKEAIFDFALEQNNLYFAHRPFESEEISNNSLFTHLLLQEAAEDEEESVLQGMVVISKEEKTSQNPVIKDILQNALESEEPQSSAQAASFTSLTQTRSGPPLLP